MAEENKAEVVEKKVPVTRSLLNRKSVVEVVGLRTCGRLLEKGVVCFFMTLDGVLEEVPYHQVILDGFPEEQAIRGLLEAGYSEKELVEYLKGRRARLASAAAGG